MMPGPRIRTAASYQSKVRTADLGRRVTGSV